MSLTMDCKEYRLVRHILIIKKLTDDIICCIVWESYAIQHIILYEKRYGYGLEEWEDEGTGGEMEKEKGVIQRWRNVVKRMLLIKCW